MLSSNSRRMNTCAMALNIPTRAVTRIWSCFQPSVSVVIVGLLQVSESIFKSVTACFALPQFVPKEVIYLLAPEKIFKCFVGKPTAPVATEAGSREQIIGHCSCRDKSTRVRIITPQIGSTRVDNCCRRYAALCDWRTGSGSLAKFTASRRASSLASSFAAERRPGSSSK